MAIIKKIHNILRKIDFFAQPVTMRFRQEPCYQSATGGFCTLILIVIFVAVFSSSVILTFQKTNITYSQVQYQQDTPSFFSTNISQDFMFAVGIQNVNMNSGPRYFDISFQYRVYYNNAQNQTKFTLNLQPCQRVQWSQIGDQFATIYDDLDLNQWLCPPTNLTLQMQGKFTSDVFQFYRIAVSKCGSVYNITGRDCVNQSVINSYIAINQFYELNFYFINKILNPGNQDYISYILDDQNYFPFSLTTGISADLFINSFTISTDESIWPFSDFNVETGGFVDSISNKYSYNVLLNNYVKLYLRKAGNSYEYDRQYTKADDTLSYIGGLFSAIIGALFLIGKYNQVSYEIEMAKIMMLDKHGNKLDADGFNFLVYLGYLFYVGCLKIGIQISSVKYKNYHQSIEEVENQMDARLIMKRLEFYENVSKVTLQEHQWKLIHLKSQKTFQQAQQLRQQYRYLKDIHKQFKNNQKNILKTTDLNHQPSIQFTIQKINKNEEKKIIEDYSSKKIYPLDGIDNNFKQQSHEDQFRQLKNNLTELNKYIILLQSQAANGNKVSQRILISIDTQVREKIRKLRENENRSQIVIFEPSLNDQH